MGGKQTPSWKVGKAEAGKLLKNTNGLLSQAIRENANENVKTLFHMHSTECSSEFDIAEDN